MFSERSKMLITDMGNTEIFEFCNLFQDTSAPIVLIYWQIGIVYCSGGRSLERSQRTKQFDKKNYDALFLRHKKTSPMVPNMELPKGYECTVKQRRCCKELANPNMEDINPYLSDGTTITTAEILCHSSGGPRSTSSSTTNLH